MKESSKPTDLAFTQNLVRKYGTEIFSADQKPKLEQILIESADEQKTTVPLLQALCALNIPQKIQAIQNKKDLYKLNKVFQDSINDLYRIFFIPPKKGVEMVSLVTKSLNLQKRLSLDIEV